MIKPVRLKRLVFCLFSFWNLFKNILIYQHGRDSKTFFTRSQKKDCCSSMPIKTNLKSYYINLVIVWH